MKRPSSDDPHPPSNSGGDTPLPPLLAELKTIHRGIEQEAALLQQHANSQCATRARYQHRVSLLHDWARKQQANATHLRTQYGIVCRQAESLNDQYQILEQKHQHLQQKLIALQLESNQNLALAVQMKQKYLLALQARPACPSVQPPVQPPDSVDWQGRYYTKVATTMDAEHLIQEWKTRHALLCGDSHTDPPPYSCGSHAHGLPPPHHYIPPDQPALPRQYSQCDRFAKPQWQSLNNRPFRYARRK